MFEISEMVGVSFNDSIIEDRQVSTTVFFCGKNWMNSVLKLKTNRKFTLCGRKTLLVQLEKQQETTKQWIL